MSKIIIEIDGVRYEFEGKATFIQERGLKKIYDDSGKMIRIEPNGHNRITLQAWNGCSTFDTFDTGQ